MDEAITPDHFPTPQAPTRPQSTAGSETAREDQALANLTHTAGWAVFTASYRERIAALKTLKGVNLSGMTFEQIGQRTMACHLAAEAMEAELNYVEGVAESLDETEA